MGWSREQIASRPRRDGDGSNVCHRTRYGSGLLGRRPAEMARPLSTVLSQEALRSGVAAEPLDSPEARRGRRLKAARERTSGAEDIAAQSRNCRCDDDGGAKEVPHRAVPQRRSLMTPDAGSVGGAAQPPALEGPTVRYVRPRPRILGLVPLGEGDRHRRLVPRSAGPAPEGRSGRASPYPPVAAPGRRRRQSCRGMPTQSSACGRT